MGVATARKRDAWRVCLLDSDPDLHCAVPGSPDGDARRAARAESFVLTRGLLSPETLASDTDGIGAFVLTGLICQETLLAGGRSLELLGPGDLLAPAPHAGHLTVPAQSTWRALEESHLALLDGEFVMRAAQVPSLLAALIQRAGLRAYPLTLRLAIAQIARLSDRLLLLLWHLADRWGVVAPGKVILSLPLSHGMLAALVCARRPSVTVSLRELAQRGLVTSVATGFVLSGNPPAELSHLLASVEDDSARSHARELRYSRAGAAGPV
jgi:CRP/FNR family cyclic AMP-dependent transcriptional regulator